MKTFLVSIVTVAAFSGAAFADEAKAPQADELAAAPIMMSEAEMDDIVAGAHIRNMLGRIGIVIVEGDPQFEALGAAGSTVRGPAPGAEVATINGLFQ